MTQADQIAILLKQVAQLQATSVTLDDIYRVMGLCTSVRQMIKDMLSVRLENLDMQLKQLRDRINRHIDDDHRRGKNE